MELTAIEIKRHLAFRRECLKHNHFTKAEKLDDNWLYNQRMKEVEEIREQRFTINQISTQQF